MNLQPTRRFAQRNAIDRLICRIEDAHGKHVLARLDRIGHIQRKDALAAFVAADFDAVEPDFGQVVHCPEPQERPTLGIRIDGSVEITPIPSNAMIARGTLLG